ncbi:DUF5686 and carboxypeptidase-like regulatory domain-containing protein [Halocola ammonii]
MPFRLSLIFFLLMSHIAIFAQHELNGKVVDSNSGEPLAFVSVVANEQQVGTYTDIDGAFKLKSTRPITKVRFSFVGYRTEEVEVDQSQKFIEIELEQQVVQLQAAEVLPGENPAHRIIKKAIENKEKNNPEKGESFAYDSYNKFYITLDIDSAILANPDTIETLDTSTQNAIKFSEKQHLFMTESVTERKFIPPDKSSETILANRISGLQTPQFGFFSTALQSFSFYENYVNLLGENYLGPLANNSIKNYLFIIEDTTYQQTDSVFVISFRPFKNKTFKGMKGLLYINTNGYALQNVIAEPAEESSSGTNLKIKQQYEFVDDKKWFPVQLNAFLELNFMQFTEEDGSSYSGLGVSRTYLRNIRIGEEFDKRGFDHVVVKMDKKSADRSEEFWNEYRKDTLSMQEMETYRVIDSIGKAENIDLKLKAISALASGKIPVKFIDIDLNKLLAFNDYEGIRLGLGAQTNWKLSEYFSFGGYGAYGFKDREWKYGGNTRIELSKMHDAFLRFSYKKDIEESGRVNYLREKSLLDQSDFYLFYANRFDRVEELKVETEARAFGYLRFNLFGSHQWRDVLWDYSWAVPANDFVTLRKDNFRVTEVGVNLRFAFKEKFMQTMNRRISMGTKYPVLHVRFAQGIDGFAEGELEYSRLNAMVEKTFKTGTLGRLSFQLEGGKTWGEVPLSYLHNAKGSFRQGEFGFSTPMAFQTMLPNEFQAREYFNFHLRYQFSTPLYQLEKSAPKVSVTHSLGMGSLEPTQRHLEYQPKDYEKGFFESGLELNSIYISGLSGFGIGAYYRHGAHAYPEFKNNLAIKVTSTINF